jgi:cobalamin biosynthesis Mg chelatase CobN
MTAEGEEAEREREAEEAKAKGESGDGDAKAETEGESAQADTSEAAAATDSNGMVVQVDAGAAPPRSAAGSTEAGESGLSGWEWLVGLAAAALVGTAAGILYRRLRRG